MPSLVIKKKGFTLIELITVLAIVGIMSAVVLASPLNLRSQNSIDLVAQQVAILIRGAQAYSSAGKSVSDASGSQFVSYGVQFYRDPSTGLYSFILWADKNPADGKYGSGELQAKYSLPSQFKITNVTCVGNGGTVSNNDRITILYKKPDPEAIFSGCGTQAAWGRVEITLTGGSRTRIIQVFNNGQISTKAG